MNELPRGGILLTVRVPGVHQTISSVTLGGKRWNEFDAQAATVKLDEISLRAPGMAEYLTDVPVRF